MAKLAPVAAALPAAVCAAVLSHPGDSLLTAYYKGEHASDSLGESVRRVLRERGVAGLFVGLQARGRRASSAAASASTAATASASASSSADHTHSTGPPVAP